MPQPVHRVLLVGFMAAGKSTVGRLLANRLAWDFVDADQEVERREGRTVAEIFATAGEAHFRRREGEVMAELLRRERCVIAAGGGWAAVPGRLDALPAGTVSVWLRVTPEEAVRRGRTAPGTRPLMGGADPVAAARALMETRAGAYAAATLEVDTTGLMAEDVSAAIRDELARLDPDLT